MTHLDSEAWLERAREALAPRETDQARVLAALEQRLQLPEHTPERSNSVEPNSGAMQNLAPKAFLKPGFLKVGATSTLVRWALRALVPVAAVGAISVMVVTTHNGQHRAPNAKASRQATRPVAAAVTQASLPEALDLALAQAQAEVTSKPEPRPAEPAPHAPHSPTEKKPARKKCRAANGSERPCATSGPTPTALASAPPTAATPVASISKELAALREAQAALRKGHPDQALDVLTRFEREAPGPGAMQEERNAAATMARCTLSKTQNGNTRELYDGFVRRYPNSAYAARLRRICSAKQ
jgi:hypothetical protein